MKEKHWKIPVVWEMMGYVEVPVSVAPTPRQAYHFVKNRVKNLPLPQNGEYLEDSFQVDDDIEDDIENTISCVYIEKK